MNTTQGLSLIGLIGSMTIASIVNASVILPIGASPTFLPGTTAAAEADLAGTVLIDNLIPFTIKNAAGAPLFEGVLQDRVSRSTRTGLLNFDFRIRNTKRGLNGIIRSVITKSFASSPRLLVDWRPDGMGQVNPVQAQRGTATGSVVEFDFDIADQLLVGGTESKFFYIKTFSKSYNLQGQTKIQLTSGESVVLNTAAPM